MHTLGEGGLEQNGDFTQGRLDIYSYDPLPGYTISYETLVGFKNGYEAHYLLEGQDTTRTLAGPFGRPQNLDTQQQCAWSQHTLLPESSAE